MTNPSSGRITYKGKNLEEIDPIEHRRKVSMLSQTPLIFDGTVEDNLQIGLQLTETTGVGEAAACCNGNFIIGKDVKDRSSKAFRRRKAAIGIGPHPAA